MEDLVVLRTSSGTVSRRLVSMTPVTPKQSLHGNLPTSTVRGSRSQSVESSRRMSSFGGTKNVRKDSRPISEKSFQQAAQTKVQTYFDVYGTEILGAGNSIRPMNTKLFVDMMDHLLKIFDSRIFITKTNYLDELPTLLKKFGYRCKVDRSWLLTVNTPHSWQHVIAVLSWLVDAIRCMDSVDSFEMMYPNNMAEDEEEDDDNDIKINKEVVDLLKKIKRANEDPRFKGTVENLQTEFIEKQIVEYKCADEDFEVLHREMDLIMEELNNEEQREEAQLQHLEKINTKYNAALQDYQQIEDFFEKSKAFVESTQLNLENKEEEIRVKKTILAKKEEELQHLQDKVNSQQFSVEDKEKMIKEKHDLLRMIQFYENSIREFEKSAYSVDLNLAKLQSKFENLIVGYNSMIAENTITEPRLKDFEVKSTLLNKESRDLLETVDQNLKSIIEENKSSLHRLTLKEEKEKSNLLKMQQEKIQMEEEKTKENALLEVVGRDFSKQEELMNKEKQKLEEEEEKNQIKTKKIVDEISQYGPAMLEEKILELKKIEHDKEVIEKRMKLALERLQTVSRRLSDKLKNAIQNRNKAADALMKNIQEFEKIYVST